MTSTCVSNLTVGHEALPALLSVPLQSRGLVVFAHGSGSSRLSPRSREVATVLHARGFATLTMDLLSAEEALDRRHVFDIPLLARRLTLALDWARTQRRLAGLPAGVFGASTGAAAALVASALRRGQVRAVVCRGGRPDLAAGALPSVTAPTLLIVGGADPDVLDLNEQAMVRMHAPAHLEIVPGAGHLFEEPGAMARVARLAADWFEAHLLPARQTGPRGHPRTALQVCAPAGQGGQTPRL
jgi:putative phosphoribosyl transferase